MTVADGSWRIERRLRYTPDRRIVAGLPQFGFHTRAGVYVVEFAAGWIGLVAGGGVAWTVGAADPGLATRHEMVPFDLPRFVAALDPSTVVVTDSSRLYRIDLAGLAVTVLACAGELGVVEVGNAVPAPDGHIWVNDIVGHQVVELDAAAEVVRRFGDGSAGFQSGTVSGRVARFGHVYDLRCGPGGLVYVLDSTNYAVRVIDPAADTVTTVCGDGAPGSRGDGGPAVDARLGGDAAADFDGPWSLALDGLGDVYVGDTHNHAVRRIDAQSGRITTVASAGMDAPPAEPDDGGPQEPAALFTKICGLDLDPVSGRLFVPDWVGEATDELVVLVGTGRP